MRKLLITTDNFLPRMDGISRFLSEMIPHLKKRFEITVVSPDFGDSKIQGINHVRIPLSGKCYGDYEPAKWDYKKIYSLVKRNDIIFNQSHGPIGINALRAAKKLRKRTVTFVHSIEWELFPRAIAKGKGIIYFILKIMLKRLYSYASTLVVPSQSIAEILNWNGIRKRKIVVRLGVDTERFRKRKTNIREELGIPKDNIVIGYHGRIGYEKNLYTLIRAYQRLNIKNKSLLVVGDGVEKIKRAVKRVKGGIAPGSVNDIERYLNAMDIYVMPSFTETTCLSLLEAMACELPAITSRVGFIKEYIMNGVNGYFFDKRSNYDLYKKLSFLIENRSLWKRLGKNARETVVKGFRWKDTAEGIINVLENV